MYKQITTNSLRITCLNELNLANIIMARQFELITVKRANNLFVKALEYKKDRLDRKFTI